MKQKPYIVGISGGSASGKTYLLKKILKLLPPEKVTLISQDNYYKHISLQERDEEGLINFDHPRSVDLDQLIVDMNKILEGETITLEEYTFNNPNIIPRMLTYKPAPLIILEGLFIFYPAELRKLMDLTIFVDAAEHVRLSRRIVRDLEERGHTDLKGILTSFEKFVAPMHREFIEPYKYQCDFIIPNNDHMDTALAVLMNHFRAIVG